MKIDLIFKAEDASLFVLHDVWDEFNKEEDPSGYQAAIGATVADGPGAVRVLQVDIPDTKIAKLFLPGSTLRF